MHRFMPNMWAQQTIFRKSLLFIKLDTAKERINPLDIEIGAHREKGLEMIGNDRKKKE